MTISVALTSFNISLGFGKHVYQINPVNLPAIGLNGNIISTTSITAAVWSKTSFAMTLLRIQDKGWMRHFIWAAIISMNILMGLNALAAWVQCTPIQKFWLPQTPGNCWDTRVSTYYGYSALMDITLAMLPWKMIWGLQMKLQEKVGVGIAMSMGLFELAIWGTCETGVTIVAASIPVLRVLIRDVATSARKYYGSSGTRTNKSRFSPGSSLPRSNTVTVTSAPQKGSIRRKWDRLADDQSDKSILGAEPELEFGKIVRTNEIVVEYDTRSETEGRNGAYEMHQMGRVNPDNMV
ncbi:uncharacterized protein ColSpa_04526 [Colletotrichum spaethianum]|uniref:Rhodopsin domain-containing protein n=1 Tax=Colletotrichum spaethianum TaxID=700344 RepID=A0AA37NZD9_9PEZI|nr:uncharacterized protein ColSpa_04526 [Colletotrichum spaethianum]GKT44345.1 hypothetical protein ColSpa_04526 [Colletotrichum spaethianum]